MNADKLQQIEKNKKVRRKFYSKEIWKSYAIVPPSGVLFIALFGFLYLFNNDLLISWYAVPFVVLLILGTVWLKATRKYIINQKISDNKTFMICLSIPLTKMNGKTIRVFSAGNNRHNKYYLEKEKKYVLERIESDPSFLKFVSSHKSVQAIPDTDLYIIYPLFSDRVSNKNRATTVNQYVVFDNSGRIKNISLRELESFS